MAKYTIRLEGDGGEFVAGEVSREIYDYFQENEIDIAEYAEDSSNPFDVPEEYQPFEPGGWFDCSNIVHVTTCDDGANVVVEDEDGEVIYEACVSSDDDNGHGYVDDYKGVNFSIYDPDGKWNEKAVFTAMRYEDGVFFEGEIEIDEPFDPKNLGLEYCNYNERNMVTKVLYYKSEDEDPIVVEGDFVGTDVNDIRFEFKLLEC